MSKRKLWLWFFIGLFHISSVCGQTYAYIESLINQGQYQKAQSSIEHVLKSTPKKAELLWLLGVIQVALERDEKALLVFQDLLKESPDFFPQGQISPKIQAIFSRAQRHCSNTMPNLAVKTNWDFPQVTFSLPLTNYFRPFVLQGVLYVRSPSEHYYLAYPMKLSKGNELITTITASNPHGTLMYYITLIGRFGQPFYYLGHSDDPLRLGVPIVKRKDLDDAVHQKESSKHEGLLLFGGATMIAITFLFGLLKIGPSI